MLTRLLRKRIIKPIKTVLLKLFSTKGLIITILIGILVSLTSSHIQDLIQRQRYLELLELEIRTNVLTYNNTISSYQTEGILYNQAYINDEVYKSGLSSGYVLSVQPVILSKLTTYYLFVPVYNQLIESSYNAIDRARVDWEDCIRKSIKSGIQCNDKYDSFTEIQKIYSEQITNTWTHLYNSALNGLSQEFNPTKDRLGSFFLSLLMGRDTLEILK